MSDVSKTSSTLLHRLTVPENVRIWAPRSVFENRCNILDAWLRAAQQVEDDYKNHKLTLFVEKNGAKSLIKDITRFQHEDVMLDLESLQNRYEAATRTVVALGTDFSQFRTEMENAKRKFEKSVRDWREEQKRKAEIDMLVTGVQAIAAIGIAIYTLGATAGGAVASVGQAAEAVDKAKKAAKEAEKALTAFQKIKLILEKIGKMKEHTEKAREFYDKVRAKLNKKSGSTKSGPDLSPSELVPPTDLDSVNYFDLLNQWDDFMLDNDALFTDLSQVQPPIANVGEFQVAMKKLVGRARNMIAAQKELQSVEEKLRLALGHEQLCAKRQQDCMDFLTSDDGELLQVRMEQGLRTIHLQVFLLFHETFCAYAFETNIKAFPSNIIFGEDKKASEYMADIAILRTSHNEHVAQHPPMSTTKALKFRTPVDISGASNIVFDPLWKDLLKSEGRVPFMIPIGHPTCQGKCFTSVVQAALYFEGITPATSGKNIDDLSVPLKIEFGPRMAQLEPSGKVSHFLSPPVEVQCEPSLIQQGDKTRFYKIQAPRMCPTLYTMGWAKIREARAKEWDLSTVTGVSLELHVQSYGDANSSD
ncbi:hypothetical protein BJ170DRAFT_684436 [Xylariales sp. AK1849]|nr:hypothetical protein BJ170DRAFT_684436 [Xylariales sp. AK1849]